MPTIQSDTSINLKDRQGDNKLSRGERVEDSALLAKNSSIEGDNSSLTEEFHSKPDLENPKLHELPDFKNFIKLLSEDFHSNNPEKTLNLKTLNTLITSTEALAQENNFAVLHTQIKKYTEDLNKVQSEDDLVDLSLKNRNETVADLISQLLDKVITAKPELLDGDSLVADEINDSVGTSQDSGEKEEKTEYTNKTFADLKERFKPIYNFFTQNSNPIVISLIGGAFHLLDGFAETMENQTAKNIQGLTRGVSVFYSRAITGLPVVVEAIDSLAKNNVTEAITRLWVLARATCSEPANMNFAPGLFMGYQFFSDLAGADKKTFNSVAENFSYIGNKAKEFYSENFKQLLGEGTLLEKFKNLSRLIVPSTMFASGIGGPIFVGNEVTSPKAKFWSNLRNAPGLLGDFLLFDMGINKVKEKHGENISKPKLIQELMKTKNGILGTAFAGLSVGATAQRYFDKYINISSQFICGLSETFTSLWSMLGKLEEKQAQAA